MKNHFQSFGINLYTYKNLPLQQEKIVRTKHQILFLGPSENSDYRANHQLKIWKGRHLQVETGSGHLLTWSRSCL